MTPEQMLDKLNEEGDNAGADYDDGIGGWFGWDVTTVRNSVSQKIKRHELAITHTDAAGKATTRTWELREIPPRPAAESQKTHDWTCEKCGSHRWVGWRNGPAHEGWTRKAQCVPCGHVQPLPVSEQP